MCKKEKERSKDLMLASEFCEDLAVELLSIAASEINLSQLLKFRFQIEKKSCEPTRKSLKERNEQAADSRGRPFLDVLIEHGQKAVVSHPSVQAYLSEVWDGGLGWGFGRLTIFFAAVLLCPPAWVFFSLPLQSPLGRAPVIKFNCHLVSHVYLTTLLILVVLNVLEKVYEVTTFVPHYADFFLLFWLSGVLVSELSSLGERSGFAIVRQMVILLSVIAVAVQILAHVYPALWMVEESDWDRMRTTQTLLYLKNQVFAFVLLCCCVQFLDFLTVHHLFGPWAVIIQQLIYDLARFAVILALFTLGFTLHITSIFQPAFRSETETDSELMRMSTPDETLQMLFYSLFGLVEPDRMPPLHLVPAFSQQILKFVFGLYMLVTLIVLINLLIAMMSDTYQRIQSQSDTEWKFGRAKLIRQMNKKSATPAPINVLTRLYTFLKVAIRHRLVLCTQKAQDDMLREANTDAYAMSREASRRDGAHHHPHKERMYATENIEGPQRLDSVIDWSSVVRLFHIYKGRDPAAPQMGNDSDSD